MSAAFVRAAWANGYSEPDGMQFPAPMSARISLAVALENFTEATPSVLTAVREAGRREALQVTIDRRRDALVLAHMAKIGPLLRSFAQRIAARVVDTTSARREDAIQAQPPDSRAAIQQAIADALDNALTAQDYAALSSLLAAAMKEAQAEGNAGAVALLASLKGTPQPSFDLTFHHALDALANTTFDPSSWVGQVLDGAGYDAAGELSAAIANGSSYDQLVQMLMDNMGASDGVAATVVDHMITTGTDQGALDLYGQENVDNVDILVSPGACDDCLALESQNPMTLDDAEGQLPQHINCRCAWAPAV